MMKGFLSKRIELGECNKAKQADGRDQYPSVVEFEYLFVIEVELERKFFIKKGSSDRISPDSNFKQCFFI